MGCSSSAPNSVAPSPTAHSDKNIKLPDKPETELNRDVQNDKETKGIKVLPTCDNLDEHIQLDRDNKSLLEKRIAYIDQGTDMNDDTDLITNVESSHSKPESHPEKLSTMEEVVEKIVELYVEEHVYETRTDAGGDRDENHENQTNQTEVKTQHLEVIADLTKEDKVPESSSPTQSESSRATRWEALADIVAELPPSLAVDPLTGQIYTLSK